MIVVKQLAALVPPGCVLGPHCLPASNCWGQRDSRVQYRQCSQAYRTVLYDDQRPYWSARRLAGSENQWNQVAAGNTEQLDHAVQSEKLNWLAKGAR